MNLNGIIFHIEEDAYDNLNKYLSTIKGYFKNSEGCDEIMNDIEARIAEMLQGKVSNAKQAVLMADVESVIAVMGKPEDFAGEGAGADNSENGSGPIGGNRNSYGDNKRRRVFRDPDDKILGGLCSGAAKYFDIDPVWFRLAFALSFFLFGTGLFLYIILCIIIPKAKTTAEKLEMHGEKVDINNIGKVVNEEFDDLKKRMKDFGNEVKSPENKERLKSTIQNAGNFLGDILQNIIKAVGKVTAFFLVFIGIALAAGLLATLFGRGTISVFGSQGSPIHFSLYEFAAAVLPSDLPIEFAVIGLILFIGIPVSLMIYGGIKYLFGIRQKNKIVKYAANILWLGGLTLLIYVGVETGSDFSEEAVTKQTIEIAPQAGTTLYLDLKPAVEDCLDLTYAHHRKIRFGDWTMLSKDENKFRLGYPNLNIVQSETGSFELVVVKSAQGYDKKEAAARAKNISYNITQSDSTILFNSYFDIGNADKLRAQDVKLILKVPVNKTLFLTRRMEKIIFDVDNVNDALDSDMVNRKWVMTKEGLECIDCSGLENIHNHK